ncbi:MAG: universal stress protein [Chloroflexota bacterium]
MTGKILVPLDGSELSESALPWAKHLAATMKTTVALCRVVRWPVWAATPVGIGYVPGDMYQEVFEAEQAEAREYLGRLARIMGEGAQAPEVHVREGEPSEGVLSLVDELGVSAIVMATHGRGGMPRLVLGSVAERILSQATVPVLLIRPEAGVTPPSLGRVLVPLDGSPLAECALDLALDVSDPNAALTLVQVLDEPGLLDPALPRGEGDVETPLARHEREAKRYLAEFVERVRQTGRSAQVLVATGDAGREIDRIAATQDIDAIVMSTHGRTGPSRWVTGSVADQVLRRADCPILLVSARATIARATGAPRVCDAMTHDTTALRSDEPLVAGVRKLVRRRESVMPVVDQQKRVVGMLSEADVLKWQASLADQAVEAGLRSVDYVAKLESTRVGDAMNPGTTSVSDLDTLDSAARLMASQHLRRLPVTRQGVLVGIVSRSDVLRSALSAYDAAARRPEAVGAR